MFVLSNLIDTVASLMDMILYLILWLIIIRALISWVSPDPNNPIVIFLMRTTDPILRPFQRLLPPMGGLDLTPIIAIFAIYFLQLFVVRTLHDIAMKLG